MTETIQEKVESCGIELMKAMQPITQRQLERELLEQVPNVNKGNVKKHALDFIVKGVYLGYLEILEDGAIDFTDKGWTESVRFMLTGWRWAETVV